MPPRARRFVATLTVVFFLAFWVWGADLIFFAVAGIGWGVPLIPLLRWTEREPK